jgi:hypothetical protein
LPSLRPSIRAQLDAKSAALAAALRDVLANHAFHFADGSGPADVEAIRFEYASDTFESTAYPIHRTRGCCGDGLPLSAIEPVFDRSAEEEYLGSVGEHERDDASEALDEVKKADLLRWFTAGWRQVRSAAPAIRGFLSVHDSTWVTDLDTGEKKKEDDTGFRFY